MSCTLVFQILGIYLLPEIKCRVALNKIFLSQIFLHFAQFNFYSSHVCVKRLVNWAAITNYIDIGWIYRGGSGGLAIGTIAPPP